MEVLKTMKIEVYARDIIIIHNDRFGLDEQDQVKLIEWFWENKPEVIVKAIADDSRNRDQLLIKEGESMVRSRIKWFVKNRPELVKEICKEENLL